MRLIFSVLVLIAIIVYFIVATPIFKKIKGFIKEETEKIDENLDSEKSPKWREKDE